MSRRRKWAIGCSIPVLLVLGVVAVFYFSMIAGMRPLEAGATLADPHAHVLKDGFAGIYVLEVGDGTVVLVDSGNDAHGQALLAGLASLHVDAAHVRAVLITHGHPDHIAGLHVLPHAEVVAGRADVGLVAGMRAARGPMPRLRGASPTGLRVTHPVDGGETLHYGDLAVDVLANPGHTAGSVAYLARGVLYLGDSAGATDDGRIVPGPWIVDDDRAQDAASLRALASRLSSRRADVRGLAFGHTAPLSSSDALFSFR